MRAILTDVTKCVGCTRCVSACKKVNKLPKDNPRTWHKNDGLSAYNWTSILHNNKYSVRKQCRHCVDPACVSVCPVGALKKEANGAVTYDGSKCLGCRYCMMACPYGIPRYTWEEPVAYIKKCILCYDNIENGTLKEPGCTSVCPTRATIYGDRDELIAEAKRRIASEPNKYMNHVYGEKEVGGTCVIYITAKDCSLDQLFYYNNRTGKDMNMKGLPSPTDPIPETTKLAMNAVPFAFVGMGAVMSGAYWIMRRREKLAEENNSEEVPTSSEEENNG